MPRQIAHRSSCASLVPREDGMSSKRLQSVNTEVPGLSATPNIHPHVCFSEALSSQVFVPLYNLEHESHELASP